MPGCLHRRPVAYLTVLAIVVAAAACPPTEVHDDAGSAGRKLEVVKPYGPDVGLRPGQEALLKVRYTEAGGAPIQGAEVRFAIYGDPRGSTLSSDRATTGPDGAAALTVRAGASTARFQVRASASLAADASFFIEASDAGFGSLQVEGAYSGSTARVLLTDVLWYLLRSGSCVGVDPMNPGEVQRTRKTTGLEQEVLFEALPVNLDHRFLARASTADGKARAVGCVELPASALRVDQKLSLTLKLSDVQPVLAGTYSLTSTITLPAGSSGTTWPRPLADALSPFADLADCPHDPAEKLLDCITDALDSGDALDCQVTAPSAKTSALVLERGAISQGCRGDLTSRGTPSLDKQLSTAMLAADPKVLAALAQVEPSARAVLGEVQILSTLSLSNLDSAGRALASHRLDSVAFGGTGKQQSFKASDIGLAIPAASALEARVQNWHLSLPSHALSLRFGLLGRLALGQGVLVPSGLPETSAALLTKVATLATTMQGSKKLSGCAAIDAMACKAARLGSGCLGTACDAGIAALASHLDAGFSALDQHKAADLTLRGEADLHDTDGDLDVDALGSSTVKGLWHLRMQLGDDEVQPGNAIFTGKRN